MSQSSAAQPPMAVRLSGVSKRFGNHQAVRDLSLAIPQGSIYGFIGPNGSGKTTTLRMILHLFLPDAGTVEVLGGTTQRAANDRIGYLPEERGLYKKMSVRRVLAYYGMLKGMGYREAHQAVLPWLDRMGLLPWAGKKVEALSKGMAQKVQFISAVIAQPQLLILDEPFSGLDPVNMEAVREAILDLRRQGTTILFSTHDMAMAETLCDFICMIYQGRKVLDGTLRTIQESYGEDRIRVRLKEGPGLLGTLSGVRVVRDLGQIQEIEYAGSSQALLQRLAAASTVELFEITHPSLHDIFIRIAGEPRPSDVQNR